MAVKINKGDALASLSLTPLIDVVFLLLIFFLVATRFEEAERELSVVLPQASEAKPLTQKPDETFINIDSQGRFVLNRETVDDANLLSILKQAWANNPVRADKRTPFQYVATAMNLCNMADIRDYRVATDNDN